MPTPAILSAQMEPPPVQPVVEMNFVDNEFKVYGGDVELDTLFYNASGPFEDIGLVPGIGITGLHWDTSLTDYNSFPPSIRGTELLNNVLIATMQGSGGLTAVCEFDVVSQEIYGANDQVPIFWIYKDHPWGLSADDSYVYWATYIETGVQTEGYAYSLANQNDNEYQGGSSWEASNDRRYRVAGTWCFDLGPTAGVNRYQGGQSIDGQPQGVDVSFGETPFSIKYNLSYMDRIAASHFFGVGVDLAEIAATGVDNGWWWWPKGGWIIRHLSFYRVRPVGILSTLAKPPHTPIRIGQLYTEVIHSPINAANIRLIPYHIPVEPLLPKMANIVVPTFELDIEILPLPITSIG